MKTKFVLAISILAVALFTACGTASDPGMISKAQAVRPIDYGQGIYYFPVVEARFGKSLAEFLKEHPELKVGAMTGNSTSGHGRDLGYFVVFEKK